MWNEQLEKGELPEEIVRAASIGASHKSLEDDPPEQSEDPAGRPGSTTDRIDAETHRPPDDAPHPAQGIACDPDRIRCDPDSQSSSQPPRTRDKSHPPNQTDPDAVVPDPTEPGEVEPNQGLLRKTNVSPGCNDHTEKPTSVRFEDDQRTNPDNSSCA